VTEINTRDVAEEIVLGDIDDVTEEWLNRLAADYKVPADLLQLACERAYGTPVQETDDLKEMARALDAVLDRHRRMIAGEVRAYARNIHDGIDGATYTAWLDAADRIERGAL
jgi:hypothetical protein